jgi:hypothetical protein
VVQLFLFESITRIDFMKTDTIQNIESFRISSLLPVLSPVAILLMFYNLRWAGVFAAVLFTAMVCSSPTRYRTRGGSLVPAVCLAAFLWLCAAVVIILGAH